MPDAATASSTIANPRPAGASRLRHTSISTLVWVGAESEHGGGTQSMALATVSRSAVGASCYVCIKCRRALRLCYFLMVFEKGKTMNLFTKKSSMFLAALAISVLSKPVFAAGACCNVLDYDPGVCISHNNACSLCGGLSHWFCQEHTSCTGQTVNRIYRNECRTMDKTCADELGFLPLCDPPDHSTEYVENEKQGDSLPADSDAPADDALSTHVPSDEELEDTSTEQPMWLLALPAFLLIPVVPVVLRRRRNK